MGITVIGGVTGVVRFTVAYDFTWMNTVRLAEISAGRPPYRKPGRNKAPRLSGHPHHLELDMTAVVDPLLPLPQPQG